MAGKKRTDAKGDRWVEQRVIVRRSHPAVARADGQTPRADRAAQAIAERHAKKKPVSAEKNEKGYTFIARPKECFLMFRGQKRGPHVSVFWGKLKPGAVRRKDCL